jgi:hypothetical protein
MPKLTEDLFAVPDGEIYPRMFKAGEEVTGQVERAARSRGILEAPKPAKKAPKTKAMKAPENK